MPDMQITRLSVHFLFLTLALFGVLPPLSAQPDITALEKPISATYRDRPLLDILQDLERNYPVRLIYNPERIPFYRLTHDFQGITLYEALNILLSGSNLSFVRWGSDKVVIIEQSKRNRADIEELVRRWENQEFHLPVLDALVEKWVVIGDSMSFDEKSRFLLTGSVTDQSDGEPVFGATVLVQETGQELGTDGKGQFELRMPPGQYSLLLRHIGYQPVLVHLSFYSNGELPLSIRQMPVQLAELMVEAQSTAKRSQTAEVGTEKLSARFVRDLTSFLGEADVLKSLQMLPGVVSVGESANGFNVRGGNIDQNLIQQDNMPIFNASHAMGFFSIFNTEAVSSTTLYKGHIPAQFGGRLSSVLEVDLKDGNTRKWGGNISAGPVSSRVFLEGPLASDKISVVLGARQSYAGWFLRLVQNEAIQNSRVDFNDALLKLTWKIDARNTLRWTNFHSFDDFLYDSEFGFAWRHLQSGLNWRHLHNDRFTTQLSLSAGAYHARQYDPEGNNGFTLRNGLDNWRFLVDNLVSGQRRQTLRFGLDVHAYKNLPETIEPRSESSVVRAGEVARDRGKELALYVQDEWTPSSRWAVSAGLRYSLYINTGPRVLYEYQEGLPLEPEFISDSVFYRRGKVLSSYQGLEPRLSVKYSLNAHRSLKFSYNRLRQYVHLVSNTIAPGPADTWQVSTPYIPPQVADQFSVGIFQDHPEQVWELSLELYYKAITDLLEYKDFPQLSGNPQIETELLQGQGRAYGAEWSFRKTKGKLTGWLSYTYARSEARVRGADVSTTINEGNWFPANFDKPHQVNFSSRWQWNPTNSLSINFTYSTGRPITAPVSNYSLGPVAVPNFSQRNQFRIPDYHRLDLAYTINNRESRLKGLRSSWTLAFYNLYARKNPFSVFFRRNDNNRPSLYRLAVVGSVIPSLNYNLTF